MTSNLKWWRNNIVVLSSDCSSLLLVSRTDAAERKISYTVLFIYAFEYCKHPELVRKRVNHCTLKKSSKKSDKVERNGIDNGLLDIPEVVSK
jgi:hypothetical protein